MIAPLAATPALADSAPDEPQEVSMPAGTEIVVGVAPALGAAVPSTDSALAAAASHPCLGTTSTYGARGCFQPYGDVIWSRDTERDGKSSAVGVYTDYGRASSVCINKGGVDTWATCNKDYWEKGNVQLRVLRYDSDTGKFYQPEDWSGWIPVDGQ